MRRSRPDKCSINSLLQSTGYSQTLIVQNYVAAVLFQFFLFTEKRNKKETLNNLNMHLCPCFIALELRFPLRHNCNDN